MNGWQVQLGVWGTILWLASFQIFGYLDDAGYSLSAKAVSGYVLGFVTAFSAYLFWEIIHGRWVRLLGPVRGWMSVLSAIPLVLLLLLGAIGFFNSIFNNMSWHYNVTFMIAGVVVSQGLIPIINYLDRD